MTNFFASLLIFAGSIFLVSCEVPSLFSNKSSSAPEPDSLALNSISPTSGVVGGSISLKGTAFDTTAANNTVLFGSVTVTVISATATTLVVEVPSGLGATSNVTVEVDDETTDSQTFTLDNTSVHFVDDSATGTDDGSSWTNAYDTITEALTAASANDEIWVAAGTYMANTAARTNYHIMVDDVDLIGGFAGSEALKSQQDTQANDSIISGDISGDDSGLSNATENFCWLVYAADNAELDGFIITGGNRTTGAPCNALSPASGGAGVINYQKTGFVVRNTTLRYNQNSTGGGGHGPGTWTSGTADTAIYDSIFDTNLTQGYGAGSCYNSTNDDGSITRTVYYNNVSTGGIQGGAIALAGLVILTNVAFISNQVTGAGGDGGAIYFSSNSYGHHRNLTFYNNSATDKGGAVYSGSLSDNVTISNSIFWDNTDGVGNYQYFQDSGGVTITFTESLVQGGLSGGVTVVGTSTIIDGGGNVTSDPLFSDTSDLKGADNFFLTTDDGLSLRASSPAVDSGTSTGMPTKDITGSNRPVGSGHDMGAYERQ